MKDPAAVTEIAATDRREDAARFFVRRFSEGVARIAAAFYPKPVIVRTSDFKTNEYARLLGGREFEPDEENPMIGFRGASRYYDPRYADGFALECAALLRARRDLGLTNIKVMIPFCRTVEKGSGARGHGRQRPRQGETGSRSTPCARCPSNAILADEFLRVFDGFSIGSNDLTQLTLGLDRDSGTVAHLFDERDEAVRWLIARAIRAARTLGKPIGICGQAPSDYPEFAAWLMSEGIDSISLNPDAAIATALRVADAERESAGRDARLVHCRSASRGMRGRDCTRRTAVVRDNCRKAPVMVTLKRILCPVDFSENLGPRDPPRTRDSDTVRRSRYRPPCHPGCAPVAGAFSEAFYPPVPFTADDLAHSGLKPCASWSRRAEVCPSRLSSSKAMPQQRSSGSLSNFPRTSS